MMHCFDENMAMLAEKLLILHQKAAETADKNNFYGS